jgi:aminotransferase EvaB
MTLMNMKKLKVPFNNLLPLTSMLGRDIEQAFNRFLYKGHYILGEEVYAFEKEFAEYQNMKCGVGVASGTDAITIALMAVNVGIGCNVLTVANSAPATVAAIKRTGASVKYVDVDKDGLMDTGLAIKMLDSSIQAVVPVHLYGRVCNIKSLCEECLIQGIEVIEDAAQAHGSVSKDYQIGSESTAACFSFYPTKNLGCYGDGGFIATNEKILAEHFMRLRNYGIKAETSKIVAEGLNSRLDEVQAAILRIKLKILDEINKHRKACADRYTEMLSGIPGLHCTSYAGSNHHLYPIFASDRNALREYLAGCGIQTLIHYPTPFYRMADDLIKPVLPRTEACCDSEISLPLWYGISTDEVEYVCKNIRRFYGH